MSASPFASSEKVNETLVVIETSNIATTQQTILQQILIACALGGGLSNWLLSTGFWNDSGVWDDTATWID